MSKASVGVVKHLPIPAKAIGPVADFSAATVAVRDIIGKRLEIDRQIATGERSRPVRMEGRQPFPTGDREATPFVVSPQGETVRADESHMGEFAPAETIPEGMTGDKELLERMGVSAELADALVTEANGGATVVLPFAAPAPGFTVGETDPDIIERVAAAGIETTLETLARANGTENGIPLLEVLAPPPTFEQH